MVVLEATSFDFKMYNKFKSSHMIRKISPASTHEQGEVVNLVEFMQKFPPQKQVTIFCL